jgi:hypothetical protein
MRTSPLIPSTTMSLLTPTALGKSERQVVHWSLRKKVWSDGTPIRATFSTSALARRSIILHDAELERKRTRKEETRGSPRRAVMLWLGGRFVFTLFPRVFAISMGKPARTWRPRAVIVGCLLLPIAVSSGNLSAHNATGNASWHTATWAPFVTTAGLSTPGPAESPYFALAIDGLGQVQALHVETFDVPDALTLETKGFSISMRAAGWQSIGADVPPGAWPAGAAGPLRLVVFAATSQMTSDAKQAGLTLSALAVDFGPSMTFKKRVTIRLPLEANAVAPPPGVEHAVHYYDANAKRWQKRKHYSQTANYALGVVPGETLSFSPYCSLRVRACRRISLRDA